MHDEREIIIRAQAGPQERFLACTAELCFFGGAAYGGKSYALLLDPLRDVAWSGFRGALFRESTPEIVAPGGLWDVSQQLYMRHGARPRDMPHLDWRFPSGAYLKLGHLTDQELAKWQGPQLTWIGFDEVTHFSERAFFWMFGRLRVAHELDPAVNVRLRMRGTCNPDPESWLRHFLRWWIDDDTGLAIPERAGVIRWFARDGDVRTYWGATVKEVRDQAPHLFVGENGIALRWQDVCHSCTFIPSTYRDNRIGLERDPGAVARLRALNAVDRARLLGANWNVKETAGELFREEWFPIVKETPPDVVMRVRYWDLAGSKRRRSNHTAGVKFTVHADGTYTVENVREEKLRPHGTEQMLANVAHGDGVEVDIHIEQDVGGGELLVDQYQRHALRGFTVYGHVVRGEGKKVERMKPVSAAAEKGHIRLIEADWNKPFLAQLQAQPSNDNDMADALSGAFAVVQQGELSFATARTGR